VGVGGDVNARGVKGETPLQLAVMRGSQPIVSFLVNTQGADTCACDSAGYTILHHAIMSRQVRKVEKNEKEREKERKRERKERKTTHITRSLCS
jgi:Ankyrin repeats (3 copies)